MVEYDDVGNKLVSLNVRGVTLTRLDPVVALIGLKALPTYELFGLCLMGVPDLGLLRGDGLGLSEFG